MQVTARFVALTCQRRRPDSVNREKPVLSIRKTGEKPVKIPSPSGETDPHHCEVLSPHGETLPQMCGRLSPSGETFPHV